MAQDLAWKNGHFDFNQVGVEQAMRQISRWYNINIEYRKKPGDIRFFGEINRNVPLSTVLLALQDAGVEFEMKGKTLMVQ
jgi:hypothetical protein